MVEGDSADYRPGTLGKTVLAMLNFFDTGIPLGPIGGFVLVLTIILGVRSYRNSRKQGSSVVDAIADMPVAGTGLIDAADKLGDVALATLDVWDCLVDRYPQLSLKDPWMVQAIVLRVDQSIDGAKARKIAEDLMPLYDPKIQAQKALRGFDGNTVALATSIAQGLLPDV